jgi:signal transduction histidine kinase
MRRRLVISTIAIVLVVLGALALPVGVLVYNAAEEQLNLQLRGQADQVAAQIAQSRALGRQVDYQALDAELGPSRGLVVRAPDGDVLWYEPLPTSTTQEARALTPSGIVVTVSTSAEPLDENFRSQLQTLLLLALGAIAAAAGLAAVQARQLARPLERLSRRANAIGDGDFSLGPFTRTHIPEIDGIGSSLETSAQRVHTMLANERHFTADATHQLRTGITGIAMRVEIMTMHHDAEIAAEAQTILEQTDQLNATIDELLIAARNRSTSERGEFDLSDLVKAHVDEWTPRYAAVRRHIGVVTTSQPPPVFGTRGLAGQVIDVLIDNALRHGAGSVTMLLDGPSVTVIDQGPGVDPERLTMLFDGPVDPAARHGRGLSLARRLAQVDGAALDVVGNRPLRLRLTLNRADPE